MQEPTAFRHQQGLTHELASWGDTRVLRVQATLPSELSLPSTQTSNVDLSRAHYVSLWQTPTSPQFHAPPQQETHAGNGRAQPHGGGGRICRSGYPHTSAPSGWPARPAPRGRCAALGTSAENSKGRSAHRLPTPSCFAVLGSEARASTTELTCSALVFTFYLRPGLLTFPKLALSSLCSLRGPSVCCLFLPQPL